MAALTPWLIAARARTLPAAIAPVLVATALAYAGGTAIPAAAALCLAFALLIQIATNYANDWIDFEKGADAADRVGPLRVVSAGMVSPAAMRTATFVVLALAFVVGLMLLLFGGWWLLPLGLVCLFLAYGYTGGPFPLAYLGLGELFVVLFFGFVAVGVTFFLQAGYLSAQALFAALAIGCLASNLLIINNHRDYPGDLRAGKKTLAVRFGQRFAEAELLTSVLLAFAALIPLAILQRSSWVLLPFILLPFAARAVMRLPAARLSGDYSTAFPAAGRLLTLFSVLLAVGILL